MIASDALGSGEPLVLLHGVGTSRVVWRRVLPLLAAGRRVLAPDLPGFGDSPPVGGGFELDAVADGLGDEFAESVGGPFDVVGNSLGGAVALVLAERRAALVRRLVLCAPAGFTPRSPLVASAAGRLGGPLIGLRRRLGAPVAALPAARRALLWGAIAEPHRLSAEAARSMLEASRGSTRIGAAVTAVLEADLRPRLARLERPVGFIWGDRDRVVPVATLSALRAVRPEAPVETIRGTAHVPQIERPAEFAAAVGRILDRI